MRGNAEAESKDPHLRQKTNRIETGMIHNLRFGDAELIREGFGDSVETTGDRTLHGRYIIRVGWDDVRGWFSEVRRISE